MQEETCNALLSILSDICFIENGLMLAASLHTGVVAGWCGCRLVWFVDWCGFLGCNTLIFSDGYRGIVKHRATYCGSALGAREKIDSLTI